MKLPLSSSPSRRILIGLFAAVSTACVVQTASAADAKPTIPIIVKDTTSFYWQIVFAGARKASKDFGVEVRRSDAPQRDQPSDRRKDVASEPRFSKTELLGQLLGDIVLKPRASRASRAFPTA